MTLVINHLSKAFNNNSVIDDISLDLESSSFISLLGPSGCGKTTLLRLIAGLITPDKGEIRHNDTIFYSSEQKVNISPDKRNLGMVFQDFALWPHMNVYDNVAYPLRAKKDTDQLNERVIEALSAVQLEHLKDRKIHELSGGQQQRVSLARAIISNNKVILMDEPLSALDATLREDMRHLIQSITKKYEMTAIFVTHDQYEAMTMSDQIIVLDKGKILQQGTPEDLYTKPATPYIAKFIGKGSDIQGTVVDKFFTTVTGLKFPIHFNTTPGPYTYIIRPESVKIDNSGYPAQIQSVSYTGERYEYVALLDETPIMLYDSNKLSIGSTVNLNIQILNHFLFKQEEQ
ncbi:ABC transporter ATP-binding protein [Macrococcus capreoli]|uniref:ABC transporter ATP-binding protein n=1 Tax=Macrococcus capreoli TaxID=2982690 RepID=UPI0021D58860|nr:ABC transporter ATP-binding protein [Macrococcus sp. TMW 2.2395]MCU7557890.1 ABC transporter ATP-binding protein [Macrococcus sp. TMW 2.2395]